MTPAAKTNCYVSRWTFGVVGSVIVVLGTALISVSWGSTSGGLKRGQKVNDRQDVAISAVEKEVAVQNKQLDHIEKTVDELKKGQREILGRLPAQ